MCGVIGKGRSGKQIHNTEGKDEMKKQERTIREEIQLIRRGIREFDKILPGQMSFLLCKSLLTAGTPWLAVSMSAGILNELTGAGDKTRLGFFVLVSAGGTLLLSVLTYWLNAKMAVGYSRLFSTHEIILTDKSFRIPFFQLERESTRKLREQISGSIGLTGGGMASLYWDMEVFVTDLGRTTAALLLAMGFLRRVASGVTRGMISAGTAAGILVLLAALTAGGALLTCKTAARRFAVSFDVFEHGAEYNRFGEFYDLSYLSDEDMAMDIRIFRQKELVLRESLVKCYRRLADGKIREMRAVSRLDVVRYLCAGICGAAVYGSVGFLAVRQVIGIGDVIMVSAAVTGLITALGGLAEVITDLRNNNVHLEKFFDYMDLEEDGGNEREKGGTIRKNMQKAGESGRKRTPVTTGYAHEKEDVGTAASHMEDTGTEASHMEDGEAAASHIEDVGTAASQMENTETAKIRRKEYEISFEGVSFRYPDSQAMVLRDINLKIIPGEKLAIAGENGSGKTTLIKLLCRLYQPTEGRILLGGQDIQSIPYEEYMRKIATVFQDFAIFAFSLAENVALSKKYDEAEVRQALFRAGLRDKVEKLPGGARQSVSHDYEEDGENLSGGESQKLAIARAIYKDASVVILDEPTAALDPYAEKEIYKQFFKNLAGETMISVSHRLSSCRFCHRIAVLDKGRLVELGSHEALLARPEGKYAQMWEAQAQYYAEGM